MCELPILIGHVLMCGRHDQFQHAFVLILGGRVGALAIGWPWLRAPFPSLPFWSSPCLVSKRKRKERRQAQQVRALERGDLGSLRAATERNPESGGNALVRALQSGGVDPNDLAVDALAASLCERLRNAGRADLVLTISNLFGSPSTALRLERALAAFSLGVDGAVAEQIAADPVVAKALAPALAAVSGTPVPRAPAHSSVELRSVYAMCRAVAAADKGSISAARTALSSVDPSRQGALCAGELRSVLTMLHGRADGYHLTTAAVGFTKTSLARNHRRVAGAFAMTLASRAPRLLLEHLLPRLPLTQQDKTAAAVRATIAASRVDSEQARVFQIISTVGAEAFPTEHKSLAYLYQGFAHVMTDPKRAREAFDRAVALGADMGEALRGRAIAERNMAMQDQSGAKIPNAASASLRLAKVLAADDDGTALAYTASRMAMEMLRSACDWKGCREAAVLVRSLAQRGGWCTDQVESSILTHEANSFVEDDWKRADTLLERALAIDPTNTDAWHGRIALAQESGEGERANALILEAADQCANTALTSQARDIRARRGERWSPAPGAASVGELARELQARLARNDAPDDTDLLPYADLRACRDALSQQQRCAFDAAHWVTLDLISREEEASRLLKARVLAPACAEPEQAKLLLIACGLGDPSGAIDLLAGLLAEGKHKELLEGASRAVANGVDTTKRQYLVRRTAPYLSRTELDRIRSHRCDEPANELDAVVRELDALLAPHFSLTEDGDTGDLFDDDLDEDASFDMQHASHGIDVVTDAHAEVMLQELGVPAGRYKSLSSPQRARVRELVAKLLRDVMHGALDPKPMLELMTILGVSPPDLPSFAPRRTRGRR